MKNLHIVLNQDISLNNSLKHLKFGVPVDITHMEVTVSQIFNLGLSILFYEI